MLISEESHENLVIYMSLAKWIGRQDRSYRTILGKIDIARNCRQDRSCLPFQAKYMFKTQMYLCLNWFVCISDRPMVALTDADASTEVTICQSLVCVFIS